ncbi:MAG: hypothetical protein RML72_07900, partial [Bacteroidia bacterium]|nr:hypothetical protein [Bacteroidia bacterium]
MRSRICFKFFLALVVAYFSFLFALLWAQGECGVIYVTPNGSNLPGAGTRTNPASLEYALSLASQEMLLIKLSTGNYRLNNTLQLKSNIILEGGYLANQNWAKTNADSTVFLREPTNYEENPLRIIAVQGINIKNFRLQDIRIVAPPAIGNGGSTYGLYLRGCENYTLCRVWIRTGNATGGVDGRDGINGVDGAPGQDGGLGCRRCDPTTPPFTIIGGRGGNSWSAGRAAGGRGGNGGARGTGTTCSPFNCDPCDSLQYDIKAPDGEDGSPGNGTTPGLGGKGRRGINFCSTASGLEPSTVFNFLNSCPSADTAKYRGGNGMPGKNGKSGRNGIDGQAEYSNGFFVPNNGTDGEDGEDGSGGGGGGGGSSIGGIPSLGLSMLEGMNSTGAGGGGGGEGGQGGTRGTGGTGGGGAFAIFLWENGPNAIIKDCILRPGRAGRAGRGGRGGFGG